VPLPVGNGPGEAGADTRLVARPLAGRICVHGPRRDFTGVKVTCVAAASIRFHTRLRFAVRQSPAKSGRPLRSSAPSTKKEPSFDSSKRSAY
jgi:hypothetical protein